MKRVMRRRRRREKIKIYTQGGVGEQL